MCIRDSYKALRAELLEKGHIFVTESDSEGRLHGFEEWGEELLPRLRGMFGFAIWNTEKKELFLARDPFGIKPMHYTRLADGRLVYGSEIKSILTHPDVKKEFNPAALDGYLSFQYSVPDETFFRDIYCLPPAHCLWSVSYTHLARCLPFTTAHARFCARMCFCAFCRMPKNTVLRPPPSP